MSNLSVVQGQHVICIALAEVLVRHQLDGVEQDALAELRRLDARDARQAPHASLSAPLVVPSVLDQTRLVECRRRQLERPDVALDLSLHLQVVDPGAGFGATRGEETVVWDVELFGELAETQRVLVVDAPEDLLTVFALRAERANEAIDAFQLLPAVIERRKVFLHDKGQLGCEVFLGPLIEGAANQEDQLADLLIVSGSVHDFPANGPRSTDYSDS